MEITKKRWFYAIVGISCMLFFGACYAWGVFVVPLEKQYGFLRTETSLAFTLNILFFAGGVFVSGYLSRCWRFSSLLRLGAFLLGAGFAIMSRASDIYSVYSSFSLLCGTGSGICYNAVLSAVPQWFPDKPGFITGLLLVGYALSTAMFGPLANFLILTIDIASAFLIIGATCCVALAILSFWISIPDKTQISCLPVPVKTENGKQEFQDVSTEIMLKEEIFWLSFFVLAFISGSGLIVINHATPLLTEELALNPSIASLALSGIFLCNATGRVCSGWLLDKTGIEKTFSFLAVSMALCMMLMTFAIYIHSPILAICASSLTLFIFGSNASMIPNSTRYLFGQKNFPLNYAVMNGNIIIVSLMPLAAAFVQMLYDGYFMLFVYLSALSLCTLILTFCLLVKLNKRKRISEKAEKEACQVICPE